MFNYTGVIMLLFGLLLFSITTARSLEIAVEAAIECPTCVLLNTTCYNLTHLFDLEAPFRNRVVIHKMGILRSENILFYSFEPAIEDPEYYKVGFVNLDNQNHSGVISGQKLIVNFGTFDIDQDNNLLYLGGNDGIFVLDMITNKLSPYSTRGDTISTLFYKNNVYFTRFEDRGIIVKKGDFFKTILEYIPVKNFVVNKNDVVVFLNNYGLFVGKGDIVHRISKNAYFRGLTIDLDGAVYAWWVDGIYKVVIEKNMFDSKIVKIANLPSIGAMTFDNENNILLTSEKGLYKMFETKYNCRT